MHIFRWLEFESSSFANFCFISILQCYATANKSWFQSSFFVYEKTCAVENFERCSSIPCWISSMEQQYSNDGWNGRHDCQQRCESKVSRCSDLPRTPARSLRTEVVWHRPATGEWRQRQPSSHMGPFNGLKLSSKPKPMASQVRWSHGSGEGPCLVPLPEQLARIWWRREWSMHQVLEHPHRCLPEFSGHWLSSVLLTVEQEREGVAEFSRIHTEPTDPMEVSFNGENRRANWPHFSCSFHGSGVHWNSPFDRVLKKTTGLLFVFGFLMLFFLFICLVV